MQHKEGFFKGLKDFKIYYQSWLPEQKPRAVLLIAHGYAEHSGRYMNVVNYFVPKGYSVYALDHRGHGRSDGERVQVDSFHDYIVDLKSFFDMVRKENPGLKIFLVGHSMGSIIALLYTVEYQKELAGLITSGSGLSRPGEPPMLPRKPGEALNSSMISRDPAVIKAYDNDPLVYRGPMPNHSGMRDGISQLYDLVPQIKLPVFIMAGDGGRDGARSRVLLERIGSKDKTGKFYTGLLHEIFNEPEHLMVLTDLEAWLKKH
ncbi:MAG TPA: lysophospholipase [Dehalococcoidales bacterium]|nr:lysophospholipase [Dehalococcoidales bacterium]